MRFALALMAGLAASPAAGGPDEVTSLFIKDSPSMLDWGIFRLEAALNADAELKAWVHYEFDRNEIVLLRSFFPETDTEDMELACRLWMIGVRSWAYVNPNTGEVFGGLANSKATDFFRHTGYTKTFSGNGVDEWLADLDKKIVLEGRVFERDKAGYFSKVQFTCRGSLLSSTMAVER